jgi:hypothetical protein
VPGEQFVDALLWRAGDCANVLLYDAVDEHRRNA